MDKLFLMKKCVIVIPIYNSILKQDEICSLRQCKKILKNHDIKVVCPENLDIQSNVMFEGIGIVRMPDKCFDSTYSYSRMLLNKDFYKKFVEYEYMLIYQLDAWVFDDRLEDWCNKGYDYVGAPWFKGYNFSAKKSKMLKYAGNGGFSLRKIKTLVDVLSDAENSNKKMKSLLEIYTKQGNSSVLNIFRLPKSIKQYYSKENKLKNALKADLVWEDNAIVNNLRLLYPQMKVILAEDAKYFAFETHPEKLYEKCGNKLPFGCHGFKKYNWNFWKDFINLESENVVH